MLRARPRRWPRSYVNWIGPHRAADPRGERAARRRSRRTCRERRARSAAGRRPQACDDLRAFVARRAAGRPADADAAGADAARLAARASSPHLIGVPLVLLVWPRRSLLLVPAASSSILLRRARAPTRRSARGRTPSTSSALAELEDHDVTNQFSAMGDAQARAVPPHAADLRALDRWPTRAATSSRRGYLARVQTIHFARWVFLDDKRAPAVRQQLRRQPRELHGRLHQQGRLGPEPRVQQRRRLPAHALAGRWAAPRTSRSSSTTIRRHQLPTEVWYKAYPGLTAVDLERNSRIREGLEQPTMTDAEAREWLRLL